MAKPKHSTSRSPWPRGRMFWGTALLSFGVCSGVLWAADPIVVPPAPPPMTNGQNVIGPFQVLAADEAKKDDGVPRGVSKPSGPDEPAPKKEAAEPKNPKPVTDTGPVTLSQNPTPKSKLIKFEMSGELWSKVIEWYSQVSGLPFVSTVKPPTGTFNFIPSKVNSKPKEYTIAEITDILNEALIEKGYIILRADASFTLHPADLKIDPSRVPLVTEEGLIDRGIKEVVQLQFKINTLDAESLVPEVAALLGPFKQVSALKEANQLVMIDQAGNLRRVVRMIREIEEDQKNAETFTHRCRFVKARDAERVLKEMLGDPMAAFRQITSDRSRDFGRGDFGRGDFGRGDFGRGDFGRGDFGRGDFGRTFDFGRGDFGRGDFGRGDFGRGDFGRGDFGRGDFGRGPESIRSPESSRPDASRMDPGRPIVSAPTVSPSRSRMHNIISDEVRNTVMVTGPQNKIAQARQILVKYDVGDKEIIVDGEGAKLKVYPVMPGSADIMANQLRDIYRNSTIVRISPVGTNQVMVWATADDHFEIRQHIQGTIETKTSSTKLIGLTSLDAKTTATSLGTMYGAPAAGGPFIEADLNRNAIIVKGTPEQIRDVQSTIDIMERNPTGGAICTPNSRVITLDKGSAANLAEALSKIYEQMGRGPVRVIAPSLEFGPAPKPAVEPKVPKKEGRGPEGPATSKPRTSPTPGERVAMQHLGDPAKMLVANQLPLFDPQKKNSKEKPKADGKSPVTITAIGGRLKIQSDDPEAVEIMTDLIRLLRAEPGEGDFTVFRLKYANAVEVAKLFDMWFNGAQQQQRGGQQGILGTLGIQLPFPFGGGGPGGSRGGGAPTAPAEPPRVRVVADPNTNTLLVRASVLDLMTIDAMLKKAIDTPETDS